MLVPALLAAGQLLSVPPPSSNVCAAIDVLAPTQELSTPKARKKADAARRRANRRRAFSARETLDLVLRTRLRKERWLSGNETLRLKLFTPRGYLYQEITLPFYRTPQSSQERKSHPYEATRVVPGFPRPLDVQKAQNVRRGRRGYLQVDTRLPVAGTSISLGSLFGRWTVVPYLNNGAAPCGKPRTFVIRE
jgi:hypothetical protein